MPNITTSRPPLPPRKPHRPSSTRRGYDERHKALRLQVLATDPICARCRAAFATDLHHRDKDVANTSIENLEGLCSRCHDAHHARG